MENNSIEDMRVQYHCKKCEKDYDEHFNLMAQQARFRIKKVVMHCPKGHDTLVEPTEE